MHLSSAHEFETNPELEIIAGENAWELQKHGTHLAVVRSRSIYHNSAKDEARETSHACDRVNLSSEKISPVQDRKWRENEEARC